MTTRSLAIKLGHLEAISFKTPLTKLHNQQYFDYLLVLDFEATCWQSHDINNRHPEIIEFPVVLYDINKNKIVEEFRQYVMPVEFPRLSDFCKQLTGIQQHQVDHGVPLQTCLMLFMQWIEKLKTQFAFSFPNVPHTSATKNCAFVTWSDWDLGSCLKNECQRKCIIRPGIFSAWIDLRAIYKEHYSRSPKGLNGAMLELGLTYAGREHCGLDDARNTAILAQRMINDGILLTITRDISVPS